MKFNKNLNKFMKPAINLVILSIFLGACKTQHPNSSTTLGENSIDGTDGVDAKACVINPSEFTWPARPKGYMVEGFDGLKRFHADPPREDQLWMSAIIDAATKLGQEKCGCRLNALAFVGRTNAWKYGDDLRPPFLPSEDDLKHLKGVVFKDSLARNQNGSGDVGTSTAYIYLFKEGSFTWRGNRGTEFWQFNEYENKTIKNGASVQFGPVEDCPSVR